jgi:iron(III) transport system ATP-binding protein
MEGINKSFATVPVVRDVTLAIGAGELFFLLGPSGCGKTTLLRCVAGFCEPDAGRIVIGDREVSTVPPHARDTGMVFQSYALWPHMTVRQNVAFGLEMRKIAKASIRAQTDEALQLVRMDERADARPNELSGGQQQRVALARAMVIRPSCLLLDEPLSNLDAKLRTEMRTEIRRICKEAGVTAIYVTHDQKEALAVADRIAVMNAGRIEQVGRPRDVYSRPATRFVAGFIGEGNFLDGRVESGDGSVVQVRTTIGIVSARAPDGGVPPPGAAVTLCIRPEAVRFGHPSAGVDGGWAGLVHNTVYLGETAQHQVALKGVDGQAIELKAFELNPSFIAGNDGQTAHVWFDPADVSVLIA